uniref:Uncharacterized protein n=1 Tax=viral metagenome TaxID=1070528 RepID=A0A6C0J6I3_9ZZZZ
MISDLLVFPLILIEAIALKAMLHGIGIANHVIYLSCLFLLLHLSFTGLMNFQLKNIDNNTPYLTKLEVSMFSAVFTSVVATGTYIIIGLIPQLKAPFFLLKYLPMSQYWYDLFIVSLPALLIHIGSRFISQSQLKY